MLSFFRFPSNFVFVGNKTSNQGGSIVSSHSDKHKPNFSGISLGLECIFLSVDFSIGDILSVLINFNIRMIVNRLNSVVGFELRGKGCALDDETHEKLCR